VPNSDENLEIFGTNPNQYKKDGALASVSVLFDVMNDIIVDSEINRYRSNERESAKNHIKKITTIKNSIILFDRGYPSKDLFQCLISNNLLFLLRLPSSIAFVTFAALEWVFILFTLNLSTIISYFSCSWMCYLIVASLSHIVLT
jgi:hypothetical protein